MTLTITLSLPPELEAVYQKLTDKGHSTCDIDEAVKEEILENPEWLIAAEWSFEDNTGL